MSAPTVLGEALAIVALAVMTIGVVGMFRMPDVYGQAHAASKGGVVGVLLLLVATLTLADWQIAARAVLIGGFLLVTMPVASHVVVRAAAARGEPMADPDTLDERPPELRGGSR